MDLLTLLAISSAPGACIMLYIYIKDKHEREPLGMLVKAFAFGALAVLVTLMISFPLEAFVPEDEQDLVQQAFHAFILVGLVEEFSKFLFVRGILYNDEHFNEPFDGIVYSVMVSMGFATLENILYVSQGGYTTAIMRMFTAVPAHATFAILMGYFLGRAKFESNKGYFSILGLIAAAAFHGAYDYFWFISFLPGIWMGAIASLIVGVWLSRKAIRVHQDASPFRHTPSEGANNENPTKNPGSEGQGFS
ncbi:MAG: PrsW family intramembrane metalloprotease [Cyclobacteriaceae bacterium]|nr:PrsW family intramembrane metalloprotease [Cyclobacteriaceae bacterium]